MKLFISLVISAISAAPASHAVAPMPAAISPARPLAAPAPPKMPLASPNAAPATHVVPEPFPVAPFEIPDDLGPEPVFLESASLESFDSVPMPNAEFKSIEQILAEQRAVQASQPPGALQQSLQAAAIQPVWTGGPNSDSGSLEDELYSETEEEDEEEYEEEEEEDDEDDYDEDYEELLQGVGFYKDGQLYPF